MIEFKINVHYMREGKAYDEPWFTRDGTKEEALKTVEKSFHEIYDCVFPEAKDAEFTLVDSYELTGA